MKSPYYFFLLLIIISFALNGQTVQLKIDKKHITEIKLSTSTGSTDIPDGYFETGDTVYFVLSSKEGDMSKGDFKDLSALRIMQDSVKKKINRLYANLDSKKNITNILLVVPRSALEITKPFEFLFEEYTSDIMAIPEQMWPYYTEFMGYYEKGKQFMDNQQYLASFDQFKYIISESAYAIEFSKFSNYNRVYNDFVPEIVAAYQNIQVDKLENLQSTIGIKDQIVLEELEEVEIAMDTVTMVNQLFDPYYRITERIPEELRLKHEKLIDDYDEFYKATYEKWKTTVLNVIESGFYRDQNKYEVFIELLTRLLVYTNQVSMISTYDSIDVSLISDTEKAVPFLKHHINLLENMEFENWKNEFVTVAGLLNEEIRDNKQILGAQHLLNLRGLVQEENQPNYYIINGFNELVKGQYDAFMENIVKAIEKCADKEMMYYLELWLFSDKFRSEDPNATLIDALNSGLSFEANGFPDDAIKQYEMAKRLGKSALPYFLIGRLKIDQFDDVFAAEQYLHDAIEIYPDFALSHVYHIESMIKNEQYKLALSEIDEALKRPGLKIWYIYFLKAKVLYHLEDFKLALLTMQTYCQTLNTNNFEQFMLLGDINLALKDCETARESYSKAGNIDPNNERYSASMENFYTKCKN